MATMKSYTNIEQSKKLAEILPLESADMHFVNDKHAGCVPYLEMTNGSNPWLKGTDISPCWSLAVLLSILDFPALTQEKDNEWEVCVCDYNNDGYIEKIASNPVDACYETIIMLHELKML